MIGSQSNLSGDHGQANLTVFAACDDQAMRPGERPFRGHKWLLNNMLHLATAGPNRVKLAKV